jgi:transcriptional regulator with XRE-family HTH domain
MDAKVYAVTSDSYTRGVPNNPAAKALLGAAIRARRKPLMTQDVFGERLGVSQALVSQWERGETMPDAYQLAQIAGLLHCNADVFLNGLDPSYDAAQTHPRGAHTAEAIPPATSKRASELEQIARKFEATTDGGRQVLLDLVRVLPDAQPAAGGVPESHHRPPLGHRVKVSRTR